MNRLCVSLFVLFASFSAGAGQELFLQDEVNAITKEKSSEIIAKLQKHAKEHNEYLIFIIKNKIPKTGVVSIGAETFNGYNMPPDAEPNSIITTIFVKEKEAMVQVGFNLAQFFTPAVEMDYFLQDLYSGFYVNDFEVSLDKGITKAFELLASSRPMRKKESDRSNFRNSENGQKASYALSKKEAITSKDKNNPALSARFRFHLIIIGGIFSLGFLFFIKRKKN